jgi:hypothetical protein
VPQLNNSQKGFNPCTIFRSYGAGGVKISRGKSVESVMNVYNAGTFIIPY